MPVDANAVNRWFDEYFETFSACARGDRDMAALLTTGRPLILTTDAAAVSLMTDEEAAAVMQSLSTACGHRASTAPKY